MTRVRPTTELHEVRAAGPSTVRTSPPHAPAVLVLDPAGEAKNGRLPATWRPLGDRAAVLWCRLPAAARQGVTSWQLADEFDTARHGVHVVAGGTAARPALTLAADCASVVRSVVLVDPPLSALPELAGLARGLGADSVPVQLVVSTTRDATDAPLPLGHPEVVSAVVQTMAAVESEAAAVRTTQPVTRPEQRSLVLEGLEAVLTVARTVLPGGNRE